MLKQEIIANIKELKSELAELNDGVSTTKEVAEKVIKQVQEKFAQYQQTQSVDDRIKLLVESSQGCVDIVENHHNSLEKKVDNVKLQIKTLENLLDRVKKFEEDAGEQNVSIEDEGEKKGDS